MKRLFSLLVVCLFSVHNLFAFNGYTHKELTSIAIGEHAIFLNDEINDILKRMLLNGGCADRDLNDNDFYDLIKHPFDISSLGKNNVNIDAEFENYRAQNPHNVLVYMFQSYTEAVDYWNKEHDYEMAMGCLGSAIRYMQDMCCSYKRLNCNYDDYNKYNTYIDEKVSASRTNLLNLLNVAIKNRDPFPCDIRIIAMNYFNLSFKSFILHGCLPSDLSFAFETTCCLIDSFCRECGIDVIWN